MAGTQETKNRLKEARLAYHTLQLGQMPRVVVDQNGERVEFTSANKADLRKYITTLETELGSECGAIPDLTNLAPMRFTF